MKFHSKKKISNSYHLKGYDPSDTPSNQEYVLHHRDFTTNHNGKNHRSHWYDQKNYLLFKKSDVFAKRLYAYTEDTTLVVLNFVPAVALILVALIVSIMHVPQALIIAALGAMLGANALRLRKKKT
mgnify:CR=1 FL=1